MRKKKRIIANWKMNPASVAEAKLLFTKTKKEGSKLEKVETIICPASIYLGMFAHLGTTRVSLGAQDTFYANGARATGEVSPEMVKDLGTSYCIVGHSERRALGESDDIVAKKALAVLKEGMNAILCIGEKVRDEDAHYYEFLKNQLRSSLAGVQRRFLTGLIVAYEPVWAIGKSARDAMKPRDIQEMAIFIRKVLTDLYGPTSASDIPIIYGAAVEEANVATILSEGGVSGLLVGHASLDVGRFTKMLKAANSV